MGNRSKDDAERFRALAKRMFFSNETVDHFLAASSAAQVRSTAVLILFEQEVRERNKRARLYRRVAFPQVKSFDGYDFSQVAFPEGYGLEGLMSLAFVDAAQDFVFHGQTGREDPPRHRGGQRVRPGRQDGPLLHDRPARAHARQGATTRSRRC